MLEKTSRFSTQRLIFSWLTTPLVFIAELITLIAFHPFVLLSFRLGSTAYHKVETFLSFFLVYSLSLCFTRFKFKPLPEIPGGRPLIFVSNHQSEIEIPMAVLAFRKYRPRFVAKIELGKGIPCISHILRNDGSVLIDRSQGARSLVQVKEFGERLIQTGDAAFIFPEGTRTTDGKMRRMKAAGVVTLLRAMPGALVIPVAVKGGYQVFSRNAKPLLAGGCIELEALPPIDSTKYKEEEITKMAEDLIRQKVESPN